MYRPAPAYPYPYPGHASPEQSAPETTHGKVLGTEVAIAQPVVINKPTAIEAVQPKKPAPKKALSDSKIEFLEKIAPMVHSVNKEVVTERLQLTELISRLDSGHELSAGQKSWLKSLGIKFRFKGESTATTLRSDLLPKVDVIPVELALAQAANESAWGKSRFAREAQNLFGVWTYDESRGIVPKKRAKGAKHLVRKYESMEESITHYITLLNSHPAYKALRDIRLQQRESGEQLDGVAMAAGLIKYSAKGEKYVAIIRSMIHTNNLTNFRSA
ncbi:MAG: glucosaminidase domain-containing protein [Gammaproteobacteria bacterium]|nr:glucosaminidase domain-containing protein [Gammaproteobacteria bacterium]